MPAFFWPVVIFPFVFSKLAFFQVLIGLTFPAYLILAWREKLYRPRPAMLYLAIVAYFAAIGISVIFSVDPIRSWWGNQERMNGLFTLLHFFAWLTMTVGMLKTWPQWKRLLNYHVGVSGFMAIVAILQKPFPSLLSFPAGPRVGGLLDNPIYMASYQIFSLFFIALLWLKEPRKGMKIFYAIVAALDLTAFVLAQSRGALLGLGVGVAVFAISYAMMTPNKKAKRAAIGLILLGIASYGLLFALKDTEFVRDSTLARFTNLQAATRTRFIAWEIAGQGFVDRPLTGWGIDTFHILFSEKYNPESLRHGYYETWFDRAHNTIMDVLSMTGLLGFVTFAAIYVTLFATVIRAYRRRWIDAPIASILLGLPVGYFVQNLFVFDHPAAFSMSYLLFGFVIAIDSSAFGMKKEGEDAMPAGSRIAGSAVAVFILLEILALFLVWKTTVQPFRASMAAIESNRAFSQGAYEESYILATRAFEIPTPYLEEQTFLQSRNFMALAGANRLEELPFAEDWYRLIVDISEMQVERHPKNVHPHFIFARFADAATVFTEDAIPVAIREYETAIERSPKRQQLYYSYARFQIRQGRFEEAEALLREVISFDEEIGEGHWILGLSLMFDQGNVQEGAESVRRSQTVFAPYALTEAKEALALAVAYQELGDTEGLKSVLQLITTLPRGDLQIYLDLARIMEQSGLIEERNLILSALTKIDEGMRAKLLPVLTGDIATIEEALNGESVTITGEDVQGGEEEVLTAEEEGGASQGPRR